MDQLHQQVNADWRDNEPTIPRKLEYMLNHGISTDIIFIVGKNQTQIPAHSLVLAAHSPKYAAGELKLELDWVEPAPFRQFLKFLYTDTDDTTNVEKSDTLWILFIARHFEIGRIVRIFGEKAFKEVTIESAPRVYLSFAYFDCFELEAAKKVKEFIIRNAADVFATDGFLEMPKPCILHILESPSRRITNLEAYDSILRWAKFQQCGSTEQPEINCNDKTHNDGLRKLLQPFLPYIDFFQFNSLEFVTHVVSQNILPDKEALEILSTLLMKEYEADQQNKSTKRNLAISSSSEADQGSKRMRMDKHGQNSGQASPATREMYWNALQQHQQLNPQLLDLWPDGQLRYYREITEACVGPDEKRRMMSLENLQNDPHIIQFLPQLLKFIGDGILINLGQPNLANLCGFMRMIKCLLKNQSISLENYLSLIIPSVIACIVSPHLGTQTDPANWALREFSAQQMAQIYQKGTNEHRLWIVELYCSELQAEKPLLSMYGAIVGLGELGLDKIRLFIIPRIKDIGIKLTFYNNSCANTQMERMACGKVMDLVKNLVAPVIREIRAPPDMLDTYTAEFGCMGRMLQKAVIELREAENGTQLPELPSSSVSAALSSGDQASIAV